METTTQITINKNFEIKTKYLILEHQQMQYVLFYKLNANSYQDFLQKSILYLKPGPIKILKEGDTTISHFFNVKFLKYLIIKVDGLFLNKKFPNGFIGSENDNLSIYATNLYSEFSQKFFKTQKSYWFAIFKTIEKANEIYGQYKK